MIESSEDWQRLFDAYILPIANHGPLTDSKITYLSGLVTGVHIFIAPNSEAASNAQEYMKSLAEAKAENFKSDLGAIIQFNNHIKAVQESWIKEHLGIQPMQEYDSGTPS